MWTMMTGLLMARVWLNGGKIRLDLKLLSWMKLVAKIRKERIRKQFTTLWNKLLVTYILSQMCILLIVKLLHMDTQE